MERCVHLRLQRPRSINDSTNVRVNDIFYTLHVFVTFNNLFGNNANRYVNKTDFENSFK